MIFKAVGDTYQGAYTLDRVVWRGMSAGHVLTLTNGSGGSTLLTHTATAGDAAAGEYNASISSTASTKGIYCSVIGGGIADIYYRNPSTLVECIRARATGAAYSSAVVVNSVSWYSRTAGGQCIITDGSGGATLVTLPSSGVSTVNTEYTYSTQFSASSGLYISTLGSGEVTIYPEAGGGERGLRLAGERWRDCHYCGMRYPRSELRKEPNTGYWVCEKDADEVQLDSITPRYKGLPREGRRRDEFT